MGKSPALLLAAILISSALIAILPVKAQVKFETESVPSEASSPILAVIALFSLIAFRSTIYIINTFYRRNRRPRS